MNTTNELTALQARLAKLEARDLAQRRALSAAALIALVFLVVPKALAATGTCPNGLPVCFTADSPALASDVNLNFATLKEWIEGKVGSVAATNVTVTKPLVATGGVSISATGSPLSVSGAILDGSTNGGGVEFRHTNGTQGIGIGFNTIYATGAAANQALQLKARGTEVVRSLSNFAVSGTIDLTGSINENQSCAAERSTGCQTLGNGNLIYLDRHAVRCAAGEYLSGYRLTTSGCAGGDFQMLFVCCSF